jgi:hypothetical protein
MEKISTHEAEAVANYTVGEDSNQEYCTITDARREARDIASYSTPRVAIRRRGIIIEYCCYDADGEYGEAGDTYAQDP